jgi:hypothetical protein
MSSHRNSSNVLQNVPFPLVVPVLPRPEPVILLQAQAINPTHSLDDKFSSLSVMDSAQCKPEAVAKQSHSPWLIDNIAACIQACLAT